MSEISDLEQALLIAAADADSRNYESADQSEETEEKCTEKETVETPVVKPQQQPKAEPKKRHLETSDSAVSPPKKLKGYADVVATHYNSIEEKGLSERSKSRIFYLRNFHNWIKSMLINEYLGKIKEGKKQHNSPVRVHDMCCGKGGDLLKWKKGGITHLICSDIASISLEQCKARYADMKSRAARERGGGNSYSIEYICADCTRVRLREKFSDPSMKLDLVSCQFAFHYSFESLPQAECMLRNAAECLQPGGYFIGTITDGYELIARARKSDSDTFGNNIFKVSLDFDINKPPLFGAKCHFQLEDVVDCPEFLVHFPTLVKLAKRFGLKLVKTEKFKDFFERMKNEGRQLLTIMRALETYPPNEHATPLGVEEDDYKHAEEFLENRGDDYAKVGTLSKSEWEASSIYTTFVFEKVKNTWSADGTPVYDI
nr:unnamed protein product [Callosobruchus chinensis]